MSTRRVKASAFDQYKAVMDERGVPYQIADNGAMVICVLDGVNIAFPRGHDSVAAVFVECDPTTVTGIRTSIMTPPGSQKAVPDA